MTSLAQCGVCWDHPHTGSVQHGPTPINWDDLRTGFLYQRSQRGPRLSVYLHSLYLDIAVTEYSLPRCGKPVTHFLRAISVSPQESFTNHPPMWFPVLAPEVSRNPPADRVVPSPTDVQQPIAKATTTVNYGSPTSRFPNPNYV